MFHGTVLNTNNRLSFNELSPNWREDIDIVREAVRQNPFALFYIPQFQDNREIALLAVQGNGHSIAAISPDLQMDEEIRSVAQKNLPERRERSWQNSEDPRIFVPSSYATFFNQIQNIYNELTCVPIDIDSGPSPFLRDSRVVLFDGTHLIPNSLLEDNYRILWLLLPSSGKHFLKTAIKENEISYENLLGIGYEPENREFAIASTYLHDLPFKQALSCIEGGNCFLFSYQGKRRAIIGELSLLTSFIALEESSLLQNVIPDYTGEPSEHAFRIARNTDLFSKNREKLEEQSLTQFFLPLLNPISDEDKIAYELEARSIDAQLKHTKEYIAGDLELPVENLLFVPQWKFHIDLELVVTPEGEVMLHDDQLSLEFLKKIEKEESLDLEQQQLLQEFKKRAEERIEKFQPFQNKRIEILRNHGCQVHLLPAVFEDYESEPKIALNYCNGIFARKGRRDYEYMENGDLLLRLQKERGHVFITTGTSSEAEEVVQRAFIRYYKANFPHLDIQPIPGVSECIGQTGGGIHCLTFEASLIQEDDVK
jgi:hypothetical protein